jgi:hypothetical protein
VEAVNLMQVPTSLTVLLAELTRCSDQPVQPACTSRLHADQFHRIRLCIQGLDGVHRL